jgi:hypothetical protein
MLTRNIPDIEMCCNEKDKHDVNFIVIDAGVVDLLSATMSSQNAFFQRKIKLLGNMYSISSEISSNFQKQKCSNLCRFLVTQKHKFFCDVHTLILKNVRFFSKFFVTKINNEKKSKFLLVNLVLTSGFLS